MKTAPRAIAFVLFVFSVATLTSFAADPPAKFDLRDVNGENYVSSVKGQQGGTCWTHGVMAAMEGNLMLTGNWTAAGEFGEPNLAEYHLDWWNGFNKYNNDDTDPPTGGGLTVHMGGDYRVASAYLVRGEGAVRDVDGQSYMTPPARWDKSYHYYYVREIEWFTAGADLENIDTIKNKIMTDGVMGTCMCYKESYIKNNAHYQPPGSSANPNHAIGIIGWDDNKNTPAFKNGAWLCKNSWGKNWGDDGFFWISYYDKHCCKHPEMGAISFQDVEPMPYNRVYYHDYHGWRDTKENSTEAFNAFISQGNGERLESVSFFTAADDVAWTVKIYDDFQGGQLLNELGTKSGVMEYTGFHTVDLDTPLIFMLGDDFYVYLELSKGGHPYDRTSDVPVLLGGDQRVTVESSASPGESFYWEGGVWKDLYDFNDTANFCIKALTNIEPIVCFDFIEGPPEGHQPIGPATVMTFELKPGLQNYVPGTGLLHFRFDPSGSYQTMPITHLGGDTYEAVLPNTEPGDAPEFYFSAQGDGGLTAYSPLKAPEYFYSFDIYLTEFLMEDDFEQDTGWTVMNLMMEGGEWERGDPAGTSAQPEDDHSANGTKCFVTGRAGGAAGDNDVDGVSTFLYSPVLDLSKGDAQVSFYLWFYHSKTGIQHPLDVIISNDAGLTYKLIMMLHHDPSWKHISFRVSDYITPNDKVQLAFRAADSPDDDVVEALLDDFRVDYLLFEPELWADAYEVPASTGGAVNFTLDAGAGNGNRSYLLLGSLTGTQPGFSLPGGHHMPLNWDAFTSLIITSLGTPSFQNFMGVLDGEGRGLATFDTLGPLDPAFAGLEAHFAYLLSHPPAWDFASNPIRVVFVP